MSTSADDISDDSICSSPARLLAKPERAVCPFAASTRELTISIHKVFNNDQYARNPRPDSPIRRPAVQGPSLIPVNHTERRPQSASLPWHQSSDRYMFTRSFSAPAYTYVHHLEIAHKKAFNVLHSYWSFTTRCPTATDTLRLSRGPPPRG